MSQSELQTRRLDLAARAIDLTLALASTTSTSNVAVKIAWEVGQWLGREGVNQYELQDCLGKAKGLVYPNQRTDDLFSKLLQPTERRRLGPMFLEQSGSLGRLIARDPALRWLISTTACLFQYHSDTEWISAALIALILDNHSGEHVQESESLFYRPAQVQIKAVVEKIILSIWHNVVNAGYTTIPLPPELQSICRHGHDLDPSDFAKVAFALTTRCRSSTVLKTRHFLRNITLWLLLHYDGTVVVNLGGSIVHRQKVGPADRELEIHVEVHCGYTGLCEGNDMEKYTILSSVAGKFEFFISGYSMNSTDSPSVSGIRQSLYGRPQNYPRDSAMWDHGIEMLIRATAQGLAHWLLQLRLSPQKTFSDLGYQALLDPESITTDAIHLQNILHRLPGILNLHWGISGRVDVVLNRKWHEDEAELFRLRSDTPVSYRIYKLMFCFPVLNDLGNKIQPDCRCNECRGKLKGTRMYRPGCLLRMAFDEVMLMLAHCVADGFGVEDTSGIPNQPSITEAMTFLLLELIQEQKIRWDTWFGIAACVYMGCNFKQSPGPEDPAFGGTSVAAIQFGGLVVQASWLDLTTQLSVIGSFSLLTAEGRLGTFQSATNNGDGNFYCVEENFAVIETENTEDNSPYVSRILKEALSSTSLVQIDEDATATDSDVILVSVHGCFYRLLTRIKTSRHWRIVDPSDAMSAVIREALLPLCVHDDASRVSTIDKDIKLYSFEEILGRWPDTVQRQTTEPRGTSDGATIAPVSGTIHVSHLLDSNLKVNVARALTVCCTSTTASTSPDCKRCLSEFGHVPNAAPLRSGEGGALSDRYVVSLTAAPSQTSRQYITQ